MTFTVIIPARFASERLPGKPLADIAGQPMIERVYRQAVQSQAQRVIVATDDTRVYETVERFGGEVCMTLASHPSGTDRLQEVSEQLALAPTDIVVNVQGDEPLIPPAVINQVAKNLAASEKASAATLSEPVADMDAMFDPNVVKVVSDHQGHALYFSRASIPWSRASFAGDTPEFPQGLDVQLAQRHIGIYAYRVSLLNGFVSWPEAPLEAWERLEQLRILHNGHTIHVAPAEQTVPGGVDTERDLAHIRQLLAE